MFEEVAAQLKKARIIPVVTLTDADSALPVANALCRGGINVIEVTFRTSEGDAGLEKIASCIKKIRSECPDILVGAGTVINAELAERAINAGASFIVSPGFNPETVDYCISRNMPVFPGVSTPSEVELALSKNLNVLKFFPAQASGGVQYINSLSGPFPNVSFIATGGVSKENAGEYLSLKNVCAVGGSWLTPAELIKNKKWDEIAKLAEDSLHSLNKPKSAEENVSLEKALYLIPVTLGETDTDKVLPSYNRLIVRKIHHFIVEDIRSARRFIRKLDKSIDIDTLTFSELNEHTDIKTISSYLDPLEKKGLAMGVISEAGCPAVADPGAQVVEMAQKKGLKVIPLVGPSSMILSVMGSGFNGQSFAFNGYLSVKDGERSAKIRQLENRAWSENQTQLFIEAPYRNLKMFEALVHTCRKDTRLCIAAGITCENEFIRTHTIAEWKKIGAPDINKVPAIFLLYRS